MFNLTSFDFSTWPTAATWDASSPPPEEHANPAEPRGLAGKTAPATHIPSQKSRPSSSWSLPNVPALSNTGPPAPALVPRQHICGGGSTAGGWSLI